jgi:hypothetical protein
VFLYSSSLRPQIANGFYKILTDDDQDAFFYYDNRDCKYGGTGSSHYNPDAHFKYFANKKNFQYLKEGFYYDVNGQIITSWDILNEGIAPTTNCFEDFWEYSLIVLRSAENHPHLVWGAYPAADPETIIGYKIYFNEHQYGQPPGNFSLLISVDANIFNFEDV